MSRLCRFFIILIAAYTAGCTPTIGSIGGSGTAERFWVVPKKDKYNQNDPFSRKDLEAYASYQGVVESVPVANVEIGIADNIDLPDVMNFIPSGDYPLKTSGKKIVVVEYRDMSDRYSIEVLAPDNSAKPGIHIEWAE